MPSGQDTTSDELQLEVMTEDESAEDTQTIDNDEGESKEIELNLETDKPQVDKLSPAEENAKRQEEAWFGKVVEGKAKVEDAPKWLQPRLNSRFDTVTKAPETEEVVKQVLTREREAQEFKDLQSQIPKLTSAQAQELQDRFAQYKPLGNVKALRTALETMGLSEKIKEAEMRGVAKGRRSLPQSGQPAVKKSGQAVVGGVPLDVIADDKKWNAMIRQG